MTTHADRRTRLLAELHQHTYVMLQPSTIEGIGVFALRDIPIGCRDMFGPPDTEDSWTALSRADIDALPPHARHVVETYCLFDAQHYFVPTAGFKRMDLACYLNHSDTPNIRSINDGDYLEATRPIAVGEELVIDYGDIVEAIADAMSDGEQRVPS